MRAQGIKKSFKKAGKEISVVKGVDLTLFKGECVAITGASGVGKSTLLHILGTLEPPTEGKVYFDGAQRNLFDLREKDLSLFRNQYLGFVFQFHYLLPEFTVLENVMLPAKKLGAKSKQEIEHDAIEKLKLLGIDDQAKKLSSRISGGQKQRVAIARALINNPAIIMGDEPTGNLDSKNANIVFDIFKELSDSQDLSLLVVTHDEDFANRTDRIIHMGDGRII